ncbi:MAG: succinate dehydrogenase, cytochrome b556 subunit [Gammaproteobacteria bacterium]|nr:succinate dehydrogenase, cytochrome b556 subunit [Gammaproteobacteria bacterium]
MQSANRPLSPHLQIYRLPMLAILSITHRVTGVALCAGALLLVYWLAALAGGPQTFATAHSIMTSWLGLLMIIGFSWALYYHLCNGIRHLVWDTGHGLTLESAGVSGWMVLAASVLLTLFTWLISYALSGGAS